jgi:hypothetical protein
MASCTSFTPTCDLDAATDGTANCLTGCTSAAETCTGISDLPSQCDDGTSTTQATCTAGAGAPDDGVWTALTCGDTGTSSSQCESGCSHTPAVPESCTGTSDLPSQCDDRTSTTDADCTAGDGAADALSDGATTLDGDGIWTALTCGVAGTSSSQCESGCSHTPAVPESCTGTSDLPSQCDDRTSTTRVACTAGDGAVNTGTWTELTCGVAGTSSLLCESGCSRTSESCTGTALPVRTCPSSSTRSRSSSSPSSSTRSRSSYDGSFDLSVKQIAGILLIFFLFISLMGFINYK